LRYFFANASGNPHARFMKDCLKKASWHYPNYDKLGG
jgi:hypothetical protein